jgi:hypothetical protein
VAPLHGGMPQGRRNRTLMALRSGELKVLVATDVAARGIGVPTISHVINFGLPMKAEDYVHRIGRTGRAGRSGRAITLAERRDVGMIRRIQQFTTQNIPVGVIEGLEPTRPAPEMFSRGAPFREGGRPPHRGGGAPGGYAGRGRPNDGGGFRDRDSRGPREGGFGAAPSAHQRPAPRAPFAGDGAAPHHHPAGPRRHEGDRGAGPRSTSGFGAGRPAPRARGNGPR